VPFFRRVVRDHDFRHGEFDTGFIERFLTSSRIAQRPTNERDETLSDIAAIAAILHTRTSVAREDSSPVAKESRWKLSGRIARRK
jgi:acetyl/propionyl-CoA carboxylase alpha subunit